MDDHRSQIGDRKMPDHVAEQFEVALGLEHRPETLGDWIDVTAERLEEADISFGVEELCLSDASPHRARIGSETRYFACVLDTLLLPFLFEELRELDIHTESPVSDSIIEVRVSNTDITGEPAGAVISFGIAADTAPPEERDGVLAYGTTQFCPYINAFADESEYERWTDDTPEAVTMSLPLEDGFALAASLHSRLTSDHS